MLLGRVRRFSELSMHDATPFASATEHLAAFLPTCRLLLQRAMRRRAERYLGRDAAYTDRAVSPADFRRILGLGNSSQAQLWLDELGIAPLNAIDAFLVEEQRRLDARLRASAERSLPIEELRSALLEFQRLYNQTRIVEGHDCRRQPYRRTCQPRPATHEQRFIRKKH